MGQYGKLTPTDKSERNKHGQRVVLYKCDCGGEKLIREYDVKQGKCTSCGCIRHNQKLLSHQIEYASWRCMIGRCYNQSWASYQNYGGRGITVCNRWRGRKGYLNFYHDMAPRLSRDLTLDRINNDGNYEPSNCRWATKKQQRENQRVCS